MADMWHWPASPRLAGLGIVPSGTDLPLDGLDASLEAIDSCVGILHVVDRLAGLT